MSRGVPQLSATGRRVEFLARAIVNRLEDRGLIECRDAEAGILIVAKALEQNFAAEEALARDARKEPRPKT